MITELGHLTLVLALALAVLQAIVPLVGAANANLTWMSVARPAARAQCLCLLASFAALTYAFVSNDFSLTYVAQNSNSALPLAYRISAVWGAHEGSLLLWALILSLWTAAVSLMSRGLPLQFAARVLGVMGLISVGFLLFTLLTSNPFLRQIPAPANGGDLNPLLQDPGLVIHPPMLYVGYVGFSVAFGFAIAGLLGGRLDSAWARWARPWTIAAWSFLTFGIALGSWWAYYELGWGGWWFWDPVENASFMPWLVGTALIHSLAATEKRDVFKSWTVLLAIAAFSLSLLGTFLVRSGVLTSVHAFASDPTRGVFILVFLGVVVGGALTLYAWRGPRNLASADYALVSRESFLLVNSVILSVATATVLLGTLYPLLLDALNLGKISVGPPYFNAVFVPLMTPIMLLLGVGQLALWRRDSLQRLRSYAMFAVIGVIVVAVLAYSMLEPTGRLRAVFGISLGVWVIAGTLASIYKRVTARQQRLFALLSLPPAFMGQCIAHIGFAVTVIGITVVSLYSVDKHLRMQPGDRTTLKDYDIHFVSAAALEGPNYSGTDTRFEITHKSGERFSLHAEKRFYHVRGMAMTEAGIDARLSRDFYIALGEQLEDGAWSVRISLKPLVRWLWLGALLMGTGGLIAAADGRFRRWRRQESVSNDNAAVSSSGRSG